MISDSILLSTGIDSLTITGFGFINTPKSLVCDLIVPTSGSDHYLFQVRKDSISPTGFVVDFSYFIQATGYKFTYTAEEGNGSDGIV